MPAGGKWGRESFKEDSSRESQWLSSLNDSRPHFPDRAPRSSRRNLLRLHQFGDFYSGACAVTWLARHLQLVRGAVNHPQPFADVGQPDSARHRLLEPFEHEAHAVVLDVYHGATVLAPASDDERAGTDLAGEPVLDRVFDERLQDHARHDDVERVRPDVLADDEPWAKADDLDVEIFVDRFQFLAKGHEVFVT